MKPTPSAIGRPAGAGDAAGSCAPQARPTRTVTGLADPSGTMKLSVAICSAIACAASSLCADQAHHEGGGVEQTVPRRRA